MMKKSLLPIISLVYIFISILFVVFSYGFVDGNLILSDASWYKTAQTMLASISYGHRYIAGAVFFLFVMSYVALYFRLLKIASTLSMSSVFKLLVSVALILSLSYTAISYDLFNYIMTSKVAFTYHENPYVIMPIDIPNEPNLAFTRAANKVALYGPTWLFLTVIPHVVGMGSVWFSLITFKIFVGIWYIGLTYLLWKISKSVQTVIFFAFNPLVLMEIMVAGHNDIVMITLFLVALIWSRSAKFAKRLGAIGLFLLSVGVKGATLPLLPFLHRGFSLSFSYRIAFWGMLLVFLLVAPIREELYPWYAVWFMPFAALLFSQKRLLEPGLAIALTIGLELRHIPYMVMGYYEGPGPMLRMLITIIPVVIFFIFWRVKKGKVGLA
jgi:hypothetical protein